MDIKGARCARSLPASAVSALPAIVMWWRGGSPHQADGIVNVMLANEEKSAARGVPSLACCCGEGVNIVSLAYAFTRLASRRSCYVSKH